MDDIPREYQRFDELYQSMIKKYTKLRDWKMVRALFRDYGEVLLRRENPDYPEEKD